MEKPYLVMINSGGVKSEKSRNEIYDFIDSNSLVQNSYEFKPDKGKIVASGFDYAFFVSSIGTIATLTDLLWRVYDKFLKKDIKNREAHSHSIEIVADGVHINFDERYLDRNDFAKKISVQLSEQRTKKSINIEIRDVIESEHWKRRK